MAFRFRAIRMSHEARKHLHWALIHTAFLFFFADLLGAFWPEFEHAWGPMIRKGVAIAAFSATLAEYVTEEAVDGLKEDHTPGAD